MAARKKKAIPPPGLIGRRITMVRQMAPNILEAEGWSHKPPMLVLDDGTHLYPSQDPEGNDGGALFGESPRELVPPGQSTGFHVFGGLEGRFLIGNTITNIRPMASAELESEGWDDEPDWAVPPVLVLESGVLLFPSRDEEGNGPGALFGLRQDGTAFAVGLYGGTVPR